MPTKLKIKTLEYYLPQILKVYVLHKLKLSQKGWFRILQITSYSPGKHFSPRKNLSKNISPKNTSKKKILIFPATLWQWKFDTVDGIKAVTYLQSFIYSSVTPVSPKKSYLRCLCVQTPKSSLFQISHYYVIRFSLPWLNMRCSKTVECHRYTGWQPEIERRPCDNVPDNFYIKLNSVVIYANTDIDSFMLFGLLNTSLDCPVHFNYIVTVS